MSVPDKPLYQHTGTALLRAATVPLTRGADWWPEPPTPRTAAGGWGGSGRAGSRRRDPRRQPGRAQRVDAIRAERPVTDKQILRATESDRPLTVARRRPPHAVRPVRRSGPSEAGADRPQCGSVPSTGRWPRSIPSGWPALSIAWKPSPNCWSAWIWCSTTSPSSVVDDSQVPHGGPNRVSVRYTSAIRVLRDAAASAAPFADLADKLTDPCPAPTGPASPRCSPSWSGRAS